MTFKFGGSGGGGGAGDTYTASTAVAGIQVENGRSYNLSNAGKLSPSNTEIVKMTSMPVPNTGVDSGSSMQYDHNIYGDRITPDGKATFHLITDNDNYNRGVFYVSLDGGATSNGAVQGQSSYGPMMYQGGYNGAQGTAYVKLISEDSTDYFYIVWFSWKYAAAATSWYNSGHGFILKKSNHQFKYANWSSYMPQFAAMGTSTSNQYTPRHHYARQSKYFYETCRNKDIFVWTYGQYNDGNGGFSMGAVDTWRSSDAAYYGGTGVGLPKSSGAQYSNTTHRDNAKEQAHMPLFKVDDANGIFIAPYYATAGSNQNEHVYIKYTIAANHTISETEIAISGTDPAQGAAGLGHWIATTNPLIFYYLYMGATTTLYYTKCTWNSDWTSATWGTQAYITIVDTTQATGYGSTYWANDQDHTTMQLKHSVPEKELFFTTGANAAGKNAAVFSFPATGTPSQLGLCTLNDELDGTFGQNMIMQSMNNGTMMSIQYGQNTETYGYACFYTDHFDPTFKKTTNQVAIARADGTPGATVNIDLKTGDTASTTLSSDFYLTKEGMSYPLAVEGAGTGALTTVIKSVQRGTGYATSSSATVSITGVDMNKAQLVINGWNSSQNKGVYGQLTASSTITVYKNNGYSYGYYYGWEVIEYV